MKRAISSFHMISHCASPLCHLFLDFVASKSPTKALFINFADIVPSAMATFYWQHQGITGTTFTTCFQAMGRLIWGWRKRCGSTWSIYQALAAISDPPKFDAKMRQKSWHAHKSIQHQSMVTLVKHAWFVNQSPASSGAQHYIWLQSRPSTVLQNL